MNLWRLYHLEQKIASSESNLEELRTDMDNLEQEYATANNDYMEKRKLRAKAQRDHLSIEQEVKTKKRDFENNRNSSLISLSEQEVFLVKKIKSVNENRDKLASEYSKKVLYSLNKFLIGKSHRNHEERVRADT